MRRGPFALRRTITQERKTPTLKFPPMPSKASVLWLSEADVTSLLDINTAIAALEHGLRLEARGEAASMTKT